MAYTQYFAPGMQLPPAPQSPFSFQLGSKNERCKHKYLSRLLQEALYTRDMYKL